MAARSRSRFDRDDDTGPRSDVYTGLLALSLIAMIVSSLLLFLDYSQYSGSVPKVNIEAPRVRTGVAAGQLPPLILPPPAPISERPFTRGNEMVAQPVKPVGGEESHAPVEPAPAPQAPASVAVEPAPAPAPAPTPEAVVPAPEPVTAPPASTPSAPVAPPPPPPPLPKSIRNLPN